MPPGPPPHAKPPRFASEGPVPSFYWVDQGFGYALAGKLPREVLLKLATLAYRDLS